MAMAPSSFTDADRGQWCRHYMDGAAGRPYVRPRGTTMGHWSRMAHIAGMRKAGLDPRNQKHQIADVQAKGRGMSIDDILESPPWR